MTKQEFCKSKLTTLLFTVQIAFIYCQNIKEDIDDFLSKLKGEIKLSGESNRDKIEQEYALLRIINSDFSTKDFYTYYHTLFDILEKEEMVTIINIRNTNGCKNGGMYTFMDSFIHSMQRNIAGDDNLPFMDSCSLTIDYIDKNCFEDFDAANTTSKNINKVYDELNKLVIDHLPEMCSAVLKENVLLRFQESFHRIADKVEESKRLDLIEPKLCSKDILLEIIDNVFDSRKVGIGNDWKFDGSKCVVNTLYSKIIEYEKNICFTYFTDDRMKFRTKLGYFTHYKHRELFKQAFKHLIAKVSRRIERNAFEQTLVEPIKIVRDGLNNLLLPKNKTQSGILFKPYSCFCYIRNLNECKDFMDSFKQCFNQLGIDEVQAELKDEYRVIIDEIHEEINMRKWIQIFVNQEILINLLHPLCQILDETNTLKNTDANQFIYIDIGRPLTKAQLENSAKRISKRPDNHIIEVFATASSIDRKSTNCKSQILTYRIDASEATNYGQITHIDRNQSQAGPVVSIVKLRDLVDRPKEIHINPSVRKYFEDLQEELLSLHIVSAKVKSGSCHIYITRSMNKNTGKEILSYIYDLPKSKTPAVNSINQRKNRHIEYMIDIPRSSLLNLYTYLQSNLLSPKAEFTIPNLWSTELHKLIYVSNTFKLTDRYASLQQMCHIRGAFRVDTCKCSFSLRKILLCELNKDYDGIRGLSECVKQLGITESEFHKIIYNCVFDKCEDIAVINHNAIDKYSNTAHQIDIFITCDSDRHIMLHVCEHKYLNDIDCLFKAIKLVFEKFIKEQEALVSIDSTFIRLKFSILDILYNKMTYLLNYKGFHCNELIVGVFNNKIYADFLSVLSRKSDHASNISNPLTTTEYLEHSRTDNELRELINQISCKLVETGQSGLIKMTSVKIIKKNHGFVCNEFEEKVIYRQIQAKKFTTKNNKNKMR